MGYTHYCGPAAKAVVVADVRKIIDASGVTICGPRSEGLPLLSGTHGIRLNGFAAAAEAYATFTLLGLAGFARAMPAWFCATKRKPDDVVVTAILSAATIHNPGSIRRDGHSHNRTTGIARLRNDSPRPSCLTKGSLWNSISRTCAQKADTRLGFGPSHVSSCAGSAVTPQRT
jgi:hypothetical protein